MPPTTDEPQTIPFVEWDVFASQFVWNPGEHVGLIGPTGSGKTSISRLLLPIHCYIIVLGTKPRDATLSSMQKENGFVRLETWQNLDPTVYPRRLIWPKNRKLDKLIAEQRKAFNTTFRRVYEQGGWTLYIDELWWFMAHLGYEKTVKTFLQQARSLHVSLVVATQRPAFIPLEVYDQSTHLFFWRDNDERNLKRISGISWLSAKLVQNAVANLRKYEVLYVNTRDGLLIRTLPPNPNARGGKK